MFDKESDRLLMDTAAFYRKAQAKLEQQFLGTVIGVSETDETLTLTYEDGRVVTMQNYLAWAEDY